MEEEYPMERKHVLTQRSPLRRLSALFLAVLLCAALLPQGAETAQAATSGAWVWEFKQAKSQSDLPTDGDWHPVILTYTYNNETYVVDTLKEEDSAKGYCSLQGIPLKGDASAKLAVGAGVLESGAMTVPDTYGGDFPYGVWIRYYGTDKSNWDCKAYAMRASKNGTGMLYSESYFVSYQDIKNFSNFSSLLKDQADDAKLGLATFQGDEQSYFPLTVLTGHKGAENGLVKIFMNVAGATDTGLYVNSGGKTVLHKSGSYDFTKYKMYVGTRVYKTGIVDYGSMTVTSGDKYVMNGGSISVGNTITVEENATLTIQGNVYFNGTIENYGTVVVEDGSLQATHYIQADSDDQTVYGCYRGHEGSSLIVLEGSSVLAGGDTTASGYNYGRTGTGIELYGGSLVNYGTVSAPFGLHLSGAADVVNKKTGALLVGYYYVPVRYIGFSGYNKGSGSADSYTGISSAVSASGATPSWSNSSTKRFPVVISCQWEGDQYPILQNYGTIMANCGWINVNNVNYDLTTAELAKILLQEDGSTCTNSSTWSKFQGTQGARHQYQMWRSNSAIKLW